MPERELSDIEVLAYLHALEARGRYRLMIWPVRCVLGTWGHNIHGPLAKEIAAWEERNQRSALKVLKGLNPMTEQYSAGFEAAAEAFFARAAAQGVRLSTRVACGFGIGTHLTNDVGLAPLNIVMKLVSCNGQPV